MNISQLREQLIDHEGERLKPYRDIVGKLTIGVGRNLDDVGISKEESDFLLNNDIQNIIDDLDRALPWWKKLDEVRQLVLADMCFNLGITRLLGFKNTLKAMEAGNYDDAAQEMQDSLWARQVGRRAVKLIDMMRTGAT